MLVLDNSNETIPIQDFRIQEMQQGAAPSTEVTPKPMSLCSNCLF